MCSLALSEELSDVFSQSMPMPYSFSTASQIRVKVINLWLCPRMAWISLKRFCEGHFSDNCLVYVFVSKKNRQRPMDSFDVIEMKLFLMFIKIQDSLFFKKIKHHVMHGDTPFFVPIWIIKKPKNMVFHKMLKVVDS